MNVYLAGAQSEHSFKIITEVKQKNMLMSYLYLRQQKKDLQYFVEMAGYDLRFMIDSGAYTFMVKPVEEILAKECGKYSPQDAVKIFVNDYLEWIERNKKYINLFVELDIAQSVWLKKDWEEYRVEKTAFFKKVRKDQKIDNLDDKIYVGKEKVFEMREQFAKLDTPCCMVLHGEEVEELMKFTNYLGVSYKQESGAFGKMFSKVKRYNLNIHGFAMTGAIIRKYPFTSADSSSWLSGSRWGLTYILQGGKMIICGPHEKERRKRFKKTCEKIGVNFEAFINDDGEAVNKFNCYQWKLYSEYMSNRWTKTRTGRALEEKLKMNEEKGKYIRDKEFIEDGIEDGREEKIAVVKHEDIEPTAQEIVPLNREWDKPYSFLKCVDCYLQKTCPKYNVEASCHYQVSVDLTKPDSLTALLNQIISLQYGRVMRGKMVEESDGGVPDKILSQEIQLLMKVLSDTKRLTQKQQDEVLLKAKGSGAITKMLESMKDRMAKN